MPSGRKLKLKTTSLNSPKQGIAPKPPAKQLKRKHDSFKGKNAHMPTILDRCVGEPLRSEKEAWKMVLENKDVIEKITYRYGLRHMVRRAYWPDVEGIVTYSVFLSALTYDENKRAAFPTHAVSCGKECKYWVFLLKSPIWVNSAYVLNVFAFIKKKKEEPGLSLEDFAVLKKYGARRVGSLRATLKALRARRGILGMGSLPGESGDGSTEAYRAPSVKGTDSIPRNKMDLHSRMEAKLDTEKAAKRIREIFREVLDRREARIVLMHNGVLTGEEMTFEAIGEKMGISRVRAIQLNSSAIRKLRNSKYVAELMEHREMMNYYSRQ